MAVKRLKQYIVTGLLGVATIFAACKSGKNAPDVSNIKVDLSTRRLDRDLLQLDTNNLSAGLRSLDAKYPDFLNFYLDTLMGFGINRNYTDTNGGITDGLKTFLTYKDYRGLFDTVNKHFPDTKVIDGDLTNAFKYMKHYYPEFKVPKLVYFISGLNNWSAITYGDVVGVGLDMYLGPKYPYYASVGIPAYVTQHLLPQYVSVNVMSAIYYNGHPFVMEGKNLLDLMIQRGKQQYFLEKVLPFANDTLRFGYTGKQMEWCHKGEADIYNFFLTQNLMYETNWQKIVRYVNDGPNATGMPAESPGNIGSWLGYKIVSAYMEQHPEMTMEKMLAQKDDAQKILQESKYKPK